MILSDRMIRAAVLRNDIVITPWRDTALGTNSYDVHLGKTLKTYVHPVKDRWAYWTDENGIAQTSRVLLSTREPTPVRTHEIGPEGFVLMPGTLYLGVTEEYTETDKYVPFVDGKSLIGRLGITIHCTAGRGDVGFRGHWTLEIHVVEPVRIFAGDPIGQLIYFETGEVDVPYNKKPSAKYNNADATPQESQMHKNFGGP